jgi:ABC-type sugar transport system ATPase subunit/ribose/xylose/arabinose/galactoside ABC-type transport system permease subunit
VQDITKTYGRVRALAPATLTLQRGEVHALVGENGSGKSTFVGIVSGTVRPDAGIVGAGDAHLSRHTPAESQRHGVLTVFQDGSILPQLTVAQNFYLGTPRDKRPAYRDADTWARDQLRDMGLGRMSVGTLAETLSPAERQLLEIARAVASQPRVLLLDEATSALDADGVDRALLLMRRAVGGGSAILFVTHRLSEVFRVADRISVLRDGAWQGTYEASSVNANRLVELMAGTNVDTEFPPPARPEEIGEVAVAARALTGPGFGPVDFSVRSGEIVGLAGADDNGQVDLLRGLARVGGPTGGLTIGASPIVSYADAVQHGALYLSCDRASESLFRALPIRENIVVGMLGQLSRLGVVSWPREKRLVDETVKSFGIRLASPEQPVTSLSGGNQQKVALGRVLASDPKVLLVEEPTQGVDVRSRMDIYDMLRDAARKGLAVVLVSSDASELAGLCDRIVVLSRGRIVAQLEGTVATEEGIVNAFTGANDSAGGSSGNGDAAAARVADTPRDVTTGRAAALRTLARQHRNAPRLALLALLLVLIGAYAQSQNDVFLSPQNLNNLLFLAVPLAAVAAAQFVVLFVGELDASVGAVMGLTVVLMSIFVTGGTFVPALLGSLAIALVVGMVVGLINGALVEGVRISAVIATIGTLGIVQGVGLMLRPRPEGTISPELVEKLSAKVSIFPWTFIVLAVLFVVADMVLRSSALGLRLRTVGLNAVYAYRLGINARWVRTFAFVAASTLAAIAGVLLAAQVGVGDSTVGNSYFLLAFAAPVIGGASLGGGQGTFVGCILGAILLVTAQNLTTILGVTDGYGYLITGCLTLLALLAYTSGAGHALRSYVRSSLLRTGIRPAAGPEER